MRRHRSQARCICKLAGELKRRKVLYMKFKIGDRVRITSQGGGKCTRHNFGIGEVVEIKDSPDCNGDYWCKDERGVGQYVNRSCFEPVKERKFKVGDKVIGNEKADEEYCITTQGWIGEVVEIKADGEIYVKSERGSSFWVMEECFDLYEEKKEKVWRIEIVPDGEETTATLYKRGKAVKSATVKRYKGDEYSIVDAADYAVKKLFEKKEKEQKSEFNVGDRVVGIGVVDGIKIDGKKGTIREKGAVSFGVEFDKNIGGHDLGNHGYHCEYGYGWYCIKGNLKLI